MINWLTSADEEAKLWGGVLMAVFTKWYCKNCNDYHFMGCPKESIGWLKDGTPIYRKTNLMGALSDTEEQMKVSGNQAQARTHLHSCKAREIEE